MKKIISLFFVCFFILSLLTLSGCSSKNEELKNNMLKYANKQYGMNFTIVDFNPTTTNALGVVSVNKLILKDKNDIHFIVSAVKNNNEYKYYDNYIDILVSHKLQEYLEKTELCQSLDGIYCINAILENRELEYKNIINLDAKTILKNIKISEIDFIYNPIGKIGYIANNISILYALYYNLCNMADVEFIDFEVVVTENKCDSLINDINSMLCPVRTPSEWYETYNLYYSNTNLKYMSKTIINEAIVVNEKNITDLNRFYYWRKDLSYDFEEYVNEIKNGKEHTTQKIKITTTEDN